MPRLTQRSFQKVLGCIGEIYAHHNLYTFARTVLKVGCQSVPVDWAACDEINLQRSRH